MCSRWLTWVCRQHNKKGRATRQVRTGCRVLQGLEGQNWTGSLSRAVSGKVSLYPSPVDSGRGTISGKLSATGARHLSSAALHQCKKMFSPELWSRQLGGATASLGLELLFIWQHQTWHGSTTDSAFCLLSAGRAHCKPPGGCTCERIALLDREYLSDKQEAERQKTLQHL